MGSMFSGNRLNKEEMEVVMNKAKEIVSSYPVVVFSKTYCGYCQRVKQLLTQLGASFKVFELDEMSDGGEIQSALSEWTGQSTVPSVFIKEKHIGGCDRVMETNKQGKLVPLLTEVLSPITLPSFDETRRQRKLRKSVMFKIKSDKQCL